MDATSHQSDPAAATANGSRAALSRRHLLRAGGVALLGLGAGPGGRPSAAGTGSGDPRAVILVTMVGGASPWETFDPQPDARDGRRGPFASISTAVPGVRITEHLPALARRLDRLTLIRSVCHGADPTHDAGLRLLMTGHPELGHPLLGSVAARQLGARRGMPPFVVLPDLVGPVEGAARPGPAAASFDPSAPFVAGGGVPGSRSFRPDRFAARLRRWGDRAAAGGMIGDWAASGGLTAGPGRDWHWNWDAERPATRDAFGATDFGRHCWLAGRLVEAGTRLVVVNMATQLRGVPTWDAHGRAPFGTWADYERTLLPAFDRGVAALLDFLQARDLLDSTLLVATPEMGRTPRINESGGRDHWPGVWSALLAGGGLPGGQVVGASDDAGQPRDRPVAVAELVATMAEALGLGRADDPDAGRQVSASRGAALAIQTGLFE